MRFSPATGAPRGRLVLLQPFAEEANKSRRMLAEIARAAAEAGWLVALGDYLGTGDSAGDFSEASWQAWVDEVALFAATADEPSLPLVVCGLRLGALLAADAVRAGLVADAVVAINPVTSGKQALTQFLRLGAAAELGQDATARIDTRELRERLARGETVEIAGYGLSPALAQGMDAAEFELGAGVAGIGWIEVGSAEGAFSPVAERALGRLREHPGRQVESVMLRGPAFWQTQEIEAVPALPGICLEMIEKLTGLARA